MKRSVLVPILAAVLTVALLSLGGVGGIGPLFGGGGDDAVRGLPPDDSQDIGPSGQESVTVPADGVLYDDEWSVTEGVWFIGGEIPDVESGSPGALAPLSSYGDGTALGVFTPALYGSFRVRMELSPSAPAVPEWCEDVFEASLRVSDPVMMVGFENYSDVLGLVPGTYRVRFCARGLDQVPEDPDPEVEDPGPSPGRYLFQVWKAPMAPDKAVRVGSKFARSGG